LYYKTGVHIKFQFKKKVFFEHAVNKILVLFITKACICVVRE